MCPTETETKFDIRKRAFEIELSCLRRQIFKTRRSVERGENVSPTFEEQRQKHKVDHTIVDVLQNAYQKRFVNLFVYFQNAYKHVVRQTA